MRTVVKVTSAAKISSTPPKHETDDRATQHKLDEIAIKDGAATRSLLAAVIVPADSQMPSKGLFTFAKKHELMGGGDDVGFWSRELGRVYDVDATPTGGAIA